MVNTKSGGEKWRQTMIAKHGSIEAVREYMANNARKNKGKSKPNSGFAANPELASVAGKKGGTISRRTK